MGAERFDDLAPVGLNCHRLIHALEKHGDIDLDFDRLTNAVRAAKNRVRQRRPGRIDPAVNRQRAAIEEKIRGYKGELAQRRARRLPVGQTERRLEHQERKLAGLPNNT